jgi:hypothetical protein
MYADPPEAVNSVNSLNPAYGRSSEGGVLYDMLYLGFIEIDKIIHHFFVASL